MKICPRDFVTRCIVYFVNISPKYIGLTIHVHTWNKISVTDFAYQYTLQMFPHLLGKWACFD